MKRHVIAALILGLIVGGLIVGLEISGWLMRPERFASDLLSDTSTRLMAAVRYGIVFTVAIGSVFLTLATSRRGRIGLSLAILFVELAGVAWGFSLYQG